MTNDTTNDILLRGRKGGGQMPDGNSLERIVALLERQIALDLYFRGANQNLIARVLQKSKSWVNDLLRGVPKGDRG